MLAPFGYMDLPMAFACFIFAVLLVAVIVADGDDWRGKR